ncbi:hypothetical protein ACRALDRAFT_2100297 [Sodiomyces alcalophilus JCM 7366]|uniref:uncharacterized protein n=1 Tax=Sodiomyces alcalophilus JCM 7366 TaxID=591952 RepID=UPI0039B5DBC2
MPFLRRRGNVVADSDMSHPPAIAGKTLPHTGCSPPNHPSDSSLDSAGDSAARAAGAARDPVIAKSPSVSASPNPPSARCEGSEHTSTTGESRSRPETPPVQAESSKHRRFSILKFRNASDTQLSLRARQQACSIPPIPRPPEIITTAPTDYPFPRNKKSHLRLSERFRKSSEASRFSRHDPSRDAVCKDAPGGLDRSASGTRPTPVPFNSSMPGPSSHSRSTTQTKLRVRPAPSFPWFSRRKNKVPVSLFELSHLPQQATLPDSLESMATSQTSIGGIQMWGSRETQRRAQNTSRPSSSQGGGVVTVMPGTIADQPPKVATTTATVATSPEHTNLPQSPPTISRLQLRARSSTISSLGITSMEDYLAPETTRTSSSTGRKNLGDVLGFNRLRQNPEPGQALRHVTLSPGTHSSSTSKNSSMQMAREPVPLPDRRDDESAVKYLARIEQSLPRGVIASALSRAPDPFFSLVLRSYMRRFSFFGDPMDMAIRKLLMEAELPKETQQIDRCLQAFANRYHECNPGIYSSPDQAYFVAFSLLILHTDVFNKNNKHKMQQADYVKNTRGEGVYEPILKCFYDNITYTPFIHVEEDVDWGGERQRTARKTRFPGGASDMMPRKPSKEPLDPYTLILDGKLDTLRPSLKDVMELDDRYNYLGTSKDLNVRELQHTFFRTGVLQIVSERSRPDAFRDGNSASNAETASQGVVDIKITKVGILWRKEAKKKKTRPRWQEWGAILTGAQLYLFRNTAWVKNLMHQHESHIKQGFYGEPIIFKPQLPEFKPDTFMPTKDAVALVDLSYKKHKHAFKYARPAAFVEEILLADSEEEMNDWLAKLNYAAAFMTSGIRMRGVVGSHYEGQSRRGIRRLDSSNTTQVIQTPTGEVSIARGRINQHEAKSILAQRRQAMSGAVVQAAHDIAVKERELEEDLRNARHLQILSPIKARSREDLLREAARMDVKIKWIRMEIWRIKCHRDVLIRDLGEEGVTVEDSSRTKSLNKDHDNSESINSPVSMGRPYTGGISTRADCVGRRECAVSVGVPAQPSAADGVNTRPRSGYSTAPSSTVQEIQSTGNGGRGHSQAREDSQLQAEPPNTEPCHFGPDAREQDILEQSSFSEPYSLNPGHSLGSGRSRANSMAGEAEDIDHRDPLSTGVKEDRTKVRRTLQRTLREGSGHLSHHRSRKGKDSVPTDISEDNIVRDDGLSRGSGSFVVHGKKASVIDLGHSLQNLRRST